MIYLSNYCSCCVNFVPSDNIFLGIFSFLGYLFIFLPDWAIQKCTIALDKCSFLLIIFRCKGYFWIWGILLCVSSHKLSFFNLIGDKNKCKIVLVDYISLLTCRFIILHFSPVHLLMDLSLSASYMISHSNDGCSEEDVLVLIVSWNKLLSRNQLCHFYYYMFRFSLILILTSS